MGSATRVHARAYRPRIERSRILGSTFWLTPRDEAICLHLNDHRVLTTGQLADLHFTSSRRARDRLMTLNQKGVVDRFRPYRYPGSAQWHYFLGELGARVVASRLGFDLKVIRHRMERDLELVRNQRLFHIVETNDFFVHLIKRCRQVPGYEVTRWWGERRCSAELRGDVRPDGLASISAFGRRLTFLVELDRGTERGDRLRRKLVFYARLAGRSEAPDAIWFLFPGERRERSSTSKLRIKIGIPVLTSHRELFYADPLGPVWLPVGSERRVSLSQLARGPSE